MNKADPNAVIDTFIAETSAALSDWRSIDEALLAHAVIADRLRLRRRAARDSFLALVIAWERFFSAWMTAAVNRDPSQAALRLTEKITRHATDELMVPSDVLSRSLLATSHLNLTAVRGILDSKGFNTVARDHGELTELSANWLAGPYLAAASAITSYQFRPAPIGRLVRNVFAHESEAALKDANGAVRSGSVPLHFRVTRVRNLDVRDWHTYIFQAPGASTARRVELFHTEFSALAERFRVV